MNKIKIDISKLFIINLHCFENGKFLIINIQYFKIMTENEKKYGLRSEDVIEKWFSISEQFGVGACFFNIDKYLKRFDSESSKNNNPEDLIKAVDYCSRLKEKGFMDQHDFNDICYLINNKYIDASRKYVTECAVKIAEGLIKKQ